ncbi:MAG: hypothetical protein ABJ370_07465 [Paracoccaceae bacterium]
MANVYAVTDGKHQLLWLDIDCSGQERRSTMSPSDEQQVDPTPVTLADNVIENFNDWK